MGSARRGVTAVPTKGFWRIAVLLAVSLMACLATCQAFVPSSRPNHQLARTTLNHGRSIHRTTIDVFSRDSALFVLPAADMTTATMVLAAAESGESWKQYVPLVVSALVITDILLGSPAANAALSVLRPKEGNDNDNQGTKNEMPMSLGSWGSGNTAVPKDSKERIDTMAVAQAALDKAAATQDLRKFLDESKSDMEKMRQTMKELDEQLVEFDQKQLKKKMPDEQDK